MVPIGVVEPVYWALVVPMLITSVVLISIICEWTFNRRRTTWPSRTVVAATYVLFYSIVALSFVLLLAFKPV